MPDHITIADDRARSFADGLQQLERDGDVSALAPLFADDATTERLDARGERRGAVEDFWREYHEQFTSISTTFSHVVESQDSFALEWTSDATLANGRSITYRGVTVIDYQGGDRIAALRTYYDSAQFTAVPVETS